LKSNINIQKFIRDISIIYYYFTYYALLISSEVIFCSFNYYSIIHLCAPTITVMNVLQCIIYIPSFRLMWMDIVSLRYLFWCTMAPLKSSMQLFSIIQLMKIVRILHFENDHILHVLLHLISFLKVISLSEKLNMESIVLTAVWKVYLRFCVIFQWTLKMNKLCITDLFDIELHYITSNRKWLILSPPLRLLMQI